MTDGPTTSNEHLYEVDGKFLDEVSDQRGEEADGSNVA